MSNYPIFLKLKGCHVVIIGGGGVALRKVKLLLSTGAKLTVVAQHVDAELEKLCSHSDVKLLKSRYSKEHLDGAILAIAATDDNKLNKQVYEHCRESRILCNVVDVPELCDFFVPAVIKRGNLQIAVSTDGNCPAYARRIREKLEENITEQHGRFLAQLKCMRKRIIGEVPEPAERERLLAELVADESFEYFVENGSAEWQSYAAGIMADKKK